MFIRKNTAVSKIRVVEAINALNDCTSLATLHHFYDFYKNLANEIKQSNIFFHCESGCGKTKVTIKSLYGTEFMYFLVDDSIELVPEDIQCEILQSVLELCKEAMECIEKRLPVAEKMDRKNRKEEMFNLVTCIVPGISLSIAGVSLHDTDIASHIAEFLGIADSEIPIIAFACEVMGAIFMITAGFITLKSFIRRNFNIGIKF